MGATSRPCPFRNPSLWPPASASNSAVTDERLRPRTWTTTPSSPGTPPLALAGVPALYFEHGSQYRGRPAGYGDSISADYAANHYHAPSDEFSEGWVYDGAIQQALFVYRVILDIAQDSTFPNWDEGSEFKGARDALMGGGSL